MKLQENINRIKEMMGLLTEVDQNTLDNLFSKLTEYGFEKKTEEEFKKATGKVLNVYGGWLYFNPKTKIRVYKLGTDDKIFFADDIGYTKTSNSQPIELSINEFVIDPPKPKEKTFDDIMFELKKLRNVWKEINLTYNNDKYTYGENKDKELPSNMLGTIKNTLKIRLIEIKNDYNQLSLSNEQKQQIDDFINTIETEAKNLNLMS